ncbi:hypothetical protein COLO4_00738, partial [Corchorus olitorius]
IWIGVIARNHPALLLYLLHLNDYLYLYVAIFLQQYPSLPNLSGDVFLLAEVLSDL